jgi:hypothetical protein
LAADATDDGDTPGRRDLAARTRHVLCLGV